MSVLHEKHSNKPCQQEVQLTQLCLLCLNPINWKYGQSSQSGESCYRDKDVPLRCFYNEMTSFIQLQQSKSPNLRANKGRVSEIYLQPEAEISDVPLSGRLANTIMSVEKAKQKAQLFLRPYGIRNKAKQSMKRHLGRLQDRFLQEVDVKEQKTQETILRTLARRYPQYKGLISAIPLVIDHLPRNLQAKLLRRMESKAFRIALILLSRWTH